MADVPPLVQAAREFNKALKDLTPPKGKSNNALPEVLQGKSGALAVTRALAEFMTYEQDLNDISNNQPVIDRLRGKDVQCLSDLITEIAIGGEPEELAQKEKLLRSMVDVRGKPLMERMGLAIRNIGRMKEIQLDDNLGDEEDPQHRRDSIRDEQRDRGTWRQSLHDGPKPQASDDEIKRSAGSDGEKIDDIVKKSLGDDGEDAVRNSSKSSDFEKGEDDRLHDQYMDEERETMRQIRAYHILGLRVKKAYEATIGRVLGQQVGAAAAR